MPTFSHGKSTRLWVNGYDVAAYFKTATVSKTADTVDVTGFNSTARQYIPGLPDATFTADGMHDAAAGASGTILHTALGVDYSVVSYYPAGTASSATGYGLYCDETSVETASPVDGVNAISMGAQSTSGAERLTAVASRAIGGTVGGTATSVDNSAATSAGWSAYLHAQGTATTLKIVVEDSANNSAFTAVGTVYNGAVSGGTAVRFSLSGSLRQYVRVVDTITSGTVGWQVGVCRTPYL